MKKIIVSVSLFVITVFGFSGCAHQASNVGSFSGMGIDDLVNACVTGKAKTVSTPYADAFIAVTKILDDNNITIYLSDKKRKYIVAMGFKKQIKTTRVGIFFEETSDTSTTIKLSSLSHLTLEKAEKMIFNEL